VIVTVCLTATTVHCAHKAKTLAGTYRFCAMHCQTLVLRANGTFQMTLDGDLFNNQQSSGRWSRDGDYVELTSDEDPCRPGMEETVTGRNRDIEIAVTDENGNPWIDGTVGASIPRLWLKAQPDYQGRAVFSIESPTEVVVDGFYTGRCVYVPSSSESDTFTIRVRPAEMPPLRQERYLIREGGIIQVNSLELMRVE
jgi:hypothetical protein